MAKAAMGNEAATVAHTGKLFPEPPPLSPALPSGLAAHVASALTPLPSKGDRTDSIPQQSCTAPWGALTNGRGG